MRSGRIGSFSAGALAGKFGGLAQAVAHVKLLDRDEDDPDGAEYLRDGDDAQKKHGWRDEDEPSLDHWNDQVAFDLMDDDVRNNGPDYRIEATGGGDQDRRYRCQYGTEIRNEFGD